MQKGPRKWPFSPHSLAQTGASSVLSRARAEVAPRCSDQNQRNSRENLQLPLADGDNLLRSAHTRIGSEIFCRPGVPAGGTARRAERHDARGTQHVALHPVRGTRRFCRLTPLWPKWHAQIVGRKMSKCSEKNGAGFRREPHSGAWPRRRGGQNAERELACNCENRARKPAVGDFRVFSRLAQIRLSRRKRPHRLPGLESRKCKILRGIRPSTRNERPH